MKIKIKHLEGSTMAIIPDGWWQVSWAQMSAMRKGQNHCEVFTGIPLDYWRAKGAVKAYIALNNLLQWARSEPVFDKNDFTLELEGHKLSMKSVKLQEETIGQYLDCEHIITDFLAKHKKKTKLNELMKLYPVIIAIYADKVLHGNYDHKRAMGLVGAIKAHPYQKIDNIGGFFLRNMTASTAGARWRRWLYSLLPKRLMRGFPLLTININQLPPLTASADIRDYQKMI